MRVLRSTEDLPAFDSPVITVGSFDGVHIAHRLLLDTVRRKAAEGGGESVVVTFWPHPRFVLEGESAPIRLLNSLEEKIMLLGQEGIDNVIIIPFTKEFSRTSPSDFNKWLREDLGAKVLVSGFNHHFGHRREGQAANFADQSEEGGPEVCVVEPMEADGEKISSSVIRSLIANGKMASASKLLGYHYFIAGTLSAIDNQQRSTETYAFRPCEEKKLIPPPGDYNVVINILASTGGNANGNIGVKPNGEQEVHFSGNNTTPAILRITPEGKLSIFPQNPVLRPTNPQRGTRYVAVSFAPGD